MILPVIGWKAASILGGAALGSAFLQNRGAAQGAQAQADMMYQQGVQNVDNIYEKRNVNYANLGEAIANRVFTQNAAEQNMRRAKDYAMFEAGPLAKERGKSMVDAQGRMNALELGEDATALRKRKNLETLQTQLALRADDANRKWGYVPSRNPFGFGGN